MQSDTSTSRLRVERRLNLTTGVPEHQYFWDGDAATSVEIRGQLVERLEGLALIMKDLGNALRWMKRAQTLSEPHLSKQPEGHVLNDEREIFDEVKAFFVAALTFYGKCFTEAEGRRTQASRDWLDKEYRDVHDQFMTFRHAFAAHSGKEKLEYAQTVVLIRADKMDFVPTLYTARIQPDVAIASAGEKGLLDLIEHVLVKVTEKHSKAAQNLIHKLIVPRGIAFWNDAATRGDVVTFDTAKH